MWHQLWHFEPTRGQLFHDVSGEREPSIKFDRALVVLSDVYESAINIAQLMIVLLKVSLG